MDDNKTPSCCRVLNCALCDKVFDAFECARECPHKKLEPADCMKCGRRMEKVGEHMYVCPCTPHMGVSIG